MGGMVLDLRDDVTGEQLRKLYPTMGDIPDLVKQAHVLSDAEAERLPDSVFALVSYETEQPIRKYACIDAGNTILSIDYFLENRGKLPESLQKTAAANLIKACGWYHLEPPEELQKIAIIGGVLGLGGKAVGAAFRNPMTALNVGMTAHSTSSGIKSGLSTVRNAESAAGRGFGSSGVLAPSQIGG